jgi:hypothetical protein
MNDEKLINAIKFVEDYYLGDGEECGERLFIDFAKKNKKVFLDAKINNSTENNFIFTELYNQFQGIYEAKLEQIILESGLSTDDFYEGLKNVKNNFYF